ncbi:MAG: DNA alkylation repair protein [Ruminococcus sp.]|nr:DNA alkylation repair protein [Ruminococcus sp.]
MERKSAVSIFDDIEAELLRLRDGKYADFQHKLTPTCEREHFIGVRTPQLRALAKELGRRDDVNEFLCALPHRYFEEDQLHSFIISGVKDFGRCIALTEAFLPYIDNWATCDQLAPKVFAKHADELLPYIDRWLASGETYTVRFAVGTLMRYFLGERFRDEYAERVAGIVSGEYYVNMMRAWYFATALAKNYDDVLPYLEHSRLDVWTHNKTIQKAVESFRVPDEHKQYLRSLKK